MRPLDIYVINIKTSLHALPMIGIAHRLHHDT